MMKKLNQPKRLNVLSLDGGGIRGLVPALFLTAIEERTGKSISELFDIIAGTSTGGILALALSKPEVKGSKKPAFKAAELIKLYEELGDQIFSYGVLRKIRTIGGLTEEKYSADGLEKLLEEYFGDVELKEALNDVLVTSYDIVNRRPFKFRSKLARRLPDYNYPMRRIARATSAAPTYFEPAKIPKEPTEDDSADYWALIDGGVYANNPGLLAYTDAIRGKEKKNICLVSIGTGTMTKPLDYDDVIGWGAVQWVRPVLDVVLDGVSDSVDGILKKLLTYDHDYHRFQLELKGVDEAMDNVKKKNLQALRALTESVIYPTKDEAGNRVLNEDLAEACDRLLINKFYPFNAKDVGEACGITYQKAESEIKKLKLDEDKTLCFGRKKTVTKRNGTKQQEMERWYAADIVKKLDDALTA